MGKFDKVMPIPENPYRIHLLVNCVLWLAGFICLVGSGGPSREGMMGFLAGVILLSLAFIFLFGVIFGWRGFSKRFSEDHLVDYWEIDGRKWKVFAEARKKSILMRGAIVGVSLALIVTGVMLFMAYADGDLSDVLPVAAMIGGFICLVVSGVIGLQLAGLRGDTGKVWLSKDGVLMNGTVFFRNTYGVFVKRCEVVDHAEGAELEIEYLVSSGKTRAEHILKVPVAEEKIATVTEVIRDWA